MIRIVKVAILGGWFVVRGRHWFPLAGPFKSRAEAKGWLNRDKRVDTTRANLARSYDRLSRGSYRSKSR